MADIPGEKELKNVKRHVEDLANKLDRASEKTRTFAGALGDAVKESKDLANKIEELSQKANRTSFENSKLAELTADFQRATDAAGVLAGVVREKLTSAFDRLGKKIISTGVGLANLAIDKLEAGIRRVYEYMERWTKAMGEFRTRMGAASQTMGTAAKLARQWEGTMHALTGQFGQGIPMVAEFAEGLQRAIKEGDKTLVMFGLKVGRTFGVTSQEVAKMSRSMENMGGTMKDQRELWGAIGDQADKAELNLAQFSNELMHSREFMVRFGKTGAKVFVESAAFVRKLGVSLKGLEGFYEMTDTFEGATKAASRLNTVFGTTIDSLGLMLEQNPAKRLDMVRQQLIGQGKAIKDLMPQEIKLISETIGLTVDETNAILKSGQTFEEYQRSKAKEVDVQKRVQQAMNKTALTMYSFSAAADKITVAIANAIRPFLKLLGLAGQGDKDFKSFSEVMEAMTKRIVGFFNALAKNDDWNEFMKKAAETTKKFVLYVADFFSPGKIDSTISRTVELFKTVWTWSKRVLTLWAGFKVAQGIGGVINGVGSMRDMIGKLQATRESVYGSGPGQADFARRGARSLLGGGRRGAIQGGAFGAIAGIAGVASGAMSAGEGAGATIGAALGGAIAGPIGAAVGGWLGSKGGKFVEQAIREWRMTPEEKALAKAREDRIAAEGRLNISSLAVEKANADLKLALGSSKTAAENLAKAHSELNEKLESQIKLQGLDSERANLVKKSLEAEVALKKAQEKQIEDALDASTKLSYMAKLGVKGAGDYSDRVKIEAKLQTEFDKIKNDRLASEKKLEEATRKGLELEIKKNKFAEASLKLQVIQASDAYGAARKQLEADKTFGKLSSSEQTRRILEKVGTDEAKSSLSDLKELGLASGGIVTRPVRALIGEAGPEAVIPLRAMASGRMRNPAKFGGSAARRLVNYAAGGSGGKKTIVIQGGDVYLDSTLVGRQMTRKLIVDND